MSNFENSGPAFPCETVGADEYGEYRLPWQGMTLRQYAAIKLRVPNSGTDWLDEMIRESLRDEFAASALRSGPSLLRRRCDRLIIPRRSIGPGLDFAERLATGRMRRIPA